jgi:hypothetical protein
MFRKFMLSLIAVTACVCSLRGAHAFDSEEFKRLVQKNQWVRCSPVITMCNRDVSDAPMTDEAKFMWGEFCYEGKALTVQVFRSGMSREEMVSRVKEEIVQYRLGSATFQENWIKACVKTLLNR